MDYALIEEYEGYVARRRKERETSSILGFVEPARTKAFSGLTRTDQIEIPLRMGNFMRMSSVVGMIGKALTHSDLWNLQQLGEFWSFA